ncbi:MAG: hypothetical protein JNN15_08630 [Blastocatellia bacterium]|nr:hypothetical protein [Blastocatellia bacterium]
MINPFGIKSTNNAQKISEIKNWVADKFGLTEEVTMLVTELHCTEPGCPPIETVIAIMDKPGNPTQYKIYKPIAEVGLEDVSNLNSKENRHKH